MRSSFIKYETDKRRQKKQTNKTSTHIKRRRINGGKQKCKNSFCSQSRLSMQPCATQLLAPSCSLFARFFPRCSSFVCPSCDRRFCSKSALCFFFCLLLSALFFVCFIIDFAVHHRSRCLSARRDPDVSFSCLSPRDGEGNLHPSSPYLATYTLTYLTHTHCIRTLKDGDLHFATHYTAPPPPPYTHTHTHTHTEGLLMRRVVSPLVPRARPRAVLLSKSQSSHTRCHTSPCFAVQSTAHHSSYFILCVSFL